MRSHVKSRFQAGRLKLCPLRPVVLISGVGGRWGSEAHDLLRRLVRVKLLPCTACCRYGTLAPGFLSCVQQRALASTLLGGTWRAPAQPSSDGQHVVVDRTFLGGRTRRVQQRTTRSEVTLRRRVTSRLQAGRLQQNVLGNYVEVVPVRM